MNEWDNEELALLNQQIEDVKSQIAANKVKSVPVPKTNIGWASYINSGDDKLLSRYQNAENAWNLMMKQAEHASELADKNRASTDADRQMEYMKNRTNAKAKLDYAQAVYTDAVNKGNKLEIAKALSDLESAKNDYNWWSNKLNIEEDVKTNKVESTAASEPEGVKPEGNEPASDLKVYLEDLKAITSFKDLSGKNAKLTEIKNNPAYGSSPELQAEYNRLNKIKDKATIAAESAEAKKAATARHENAKKGSRSQYRTYCESEQGKKDLKLLGIANPYAKGAK